MKKILLRTLLSSLFYITFTFGASFTVLANVGTASLNAFSLAVSDITSIKVGSLLAGINIGFALIYAFMTKFKYLLLGTIQIIAFLVFGVALNFLLYEVFKDITFNYYVQRILLLILGIFIAGTSIGVVTVLRIITFPVETVCHQLEIFGLISFMKARYLIDVIFITLAIFIPLIFGETLYIREGTLLTMIIFSYVMNASKVLTEKYLVPKLF